MTARRIGGVLQFLMTGVNAEAGGLPGDLVHEVSYPGYGSSIATAPRAAVIRTWGDVYQGKRLIANPNVFPTRGLHWANDQLYWAYGDAYNVVSNHDPSIGTSVLNADGSVQAYGPWRTQEHSQKTRGYMLTVPAWFTHTPTAAPSVWVPRSRRVISCPHGGHFWPRPHCRPTAHRPTCRGHRTSHWPASH